MVTPALAAFASQLLDAAGNGGDGSQVANALTRLRLLVRLDLLPPEDRPRVIEIAGTRLSDTCEPMVWLAAVELAVATGDERLRSMVEDIGSGAVQPHGLETLDARLFLRTAAQRALHYATIWTGVHPQK